MSAFGPAENCPDCNGLYQQLEEQGRVLAERTAERDALAATVEKLIAGGDELRAFLAAAIGRFEDKAAELAAIAVAVEEAGIVPRADDTLLERVHRLIADANQIEGERDTLARVLEARDDEAEKNIRAESAIRLDERQRAKAEHEALEDAGRQRDANRIERLEGELARLRVIVDDADKAKAEHAATRDELRRLHDVLSGRRGATDEAGFKAYKATLPPLLRCDGACGYSCRLSHLKPGARCPNEDGTLQLTGDSDR